MRTYKETDFSKVATDAGKFMLVSEASDLAWPAGRCMAEFNIEGYGRFTYSWNPEADIFVYANSAGIVAQVFND